MMQGFDENRNEVAEVDDIAAEPASFEPNEVVEVEDDNFENCEQNDAAVADNNAEGVEDTDDSYNEFDDCEINTDQESVQVVEDNFDDSNNEFDQLNEDSQEKLTGTAAETLSEQTETTEETEGTEEQVTDHAANTSSEGTSETEENIDVDDAVTENSEETVETTNEEVTEELEGNPDAESDETAIAEVTEEPAGDAETENAGEQTAEETDGEITEQTETTEETESTEEEVREDTTAASAEGTSETEEGTDVDDAVTENSEKTVETTNEEVTEELEGNPDAESDETAIAEVTEEPAADAETENAGEQTAEETDGAITEKTETTEETESTEEEVREDTTAASAEGTSETEEGTCADDAEVKNSEETDETANEETGEGVAEQTETTEETESTEEQVTEDAATTPAEQTSETEENTDVDDAVTENSEETVEPTNEEVTEEPEGDSDAESTGEQATEEPEEEVTEQTETTEETESPEEQVTDDTTAASAEGTGETEESTGTEGAESKNGEESDETAGAEVTEEPEGDSDAESTGEQATEEPEEEVTEQTETTEETESTEEQVTDDTTTATAEGTGETEESTDADGAGTKNGEESNETTNEEVTEEPEGNSDAESTGEQTTEDTDEAVTEQTETTEETESPEEQVTDDTTAAATEGTDKTEESTDADGTETKNGAETAETANAEVTEEPTGDAETENAGEQTAEETGGEVTEQTDTTEETESTEEQVTDDTTTTTAEGIGETEENADADGGETKNSEETSETTNEEVMEETEGDAETENTGVQGAEEEAKASEEVTEQAETTEETEGTEEQVTEETANTSAEGTSETEESTDADGGEAKNNEETVETTTASTEVKDGTETSEETANVEEQDETKGAYTTSPTESTNVTTDKTGTASDANSSNGGKIETSEEEKPIEKTDSADTIIVVDHKTGSTYSEYAEGRTKPGEALDFVRDKDARGGFLIKDGNRWREMTDEEYDYYNGSTKQAELDQLQEKLSINATFDQKVEEYRREGKEVYDLERQRAEALEKLDQKYRNSFDAVERVKEYHKLKSEGKDVNINNNQINDIDAEIAKLKSPESVPSEISAKHTFDDWINTNNYDENGNYVGKGKDWGYKPYGKDVSELEDTLQSPAQQNITEYMKQHNYGKNDYAEYSRDPEWQRLNAELQKEQANNIEEANSTATKEFEFNKKQIDSIDTEVERQNHSEQISYQDAKLIQEKAEKELTDIETKKKDLQDDAVRKFDNVLKLRGTDEYKAALADYNATKQQIEDIKTEQDSLQKYVADIEQEKLKLREEEIRKGEMAAAASAATLVAVASLDNDYHNEVNTQELNQKRIEEIRLKNTETIQQLTRYRKTIYLALDAKKDAISEYINKNNMERSDTERDPYYKEMQDDYLKLLSQLQIIDERLLPTQTEIKNKNIDVKFQNDNPPPEDSKYQQDNVPPKDSNEKTSKRLDFKKARGYSYNSKVLTDDRVNFTGFTDEERSGIEYQKRIAEDKMFAEIREIKSFEQSGKDSSYLDSEIPKLEEKIKQIKDKYNNQLDEIEIYRKYYNEDRKQDLNWTENIKGDERIRQNIKNIRANCLKITKEKYNEVRVVAQKDIDGMNFTDHGWGHVEMVAEKCYEFIPEYNKAIKDNALQVSDGALKFKELNENDIYCLIGAAYGHDTGMAGGEYKLNNEKNPIELDMDNFKDIREAHSLNSAINILKNRNEYVKAGYTDEQVDYMAVLAMAHSKSNSGVADVNSKIMWVNCLDSINKVVQKYHKEGNISITFDDKKSFGESEQEREEMFGKLATSAQILREADGSRDSGPGATSLSGQVVTVKPDGTVIRENKEDISKQEKANLKIAEEKAKKRVEETMQDKKIIDKEKSIIEKDINEGIVHNKKSIEVHRGEQNIRKHSVRYDGISKSMNHYIDVRTGNFPGETFQAVKEMCGELNSNSCKQGSFKLIVNFDDIKNIHYVKVEWNKMRSDYIKECQKKEKNYVKIVFPWEQ